MKIRLPFFLQFTIILSLFHLSGFTQEINFEVVKPPKDVPWQLISGISQGPDGFLWLANYTGVYKYDGQQYTHYLHDPKNPNSIADNRIECILAANAGNTWIGTYVSGLDHLDPATGIVTHFRHQANDPTSLSNDTVTVLMQDKQGTLWVGTYGGLDRFNPTTRTFTHFAHIPNDSTSLSNNLVRAIYEDHEGVIWVGTGSPFGENAQGGAAGLNRFDRKTGTFKSYLHDPNNPNSIADNRVRAIFEDSKGNFWVGTAGDGLQTLNRATGVFTHYYYDPAHPEKLSRPALEKTLNYADDHITFITEDNAGRIWIGTMQGGINVYNPSTKRVTHYGADKNSKEQLATNLFWYAYKTRDGIIWISTWGANNGIYNLYKINPYQNKLPHHYIRGGVNAFAEDSSHTLWLASSRGLTHIDSNGDEHKFLIDKDTSSPKNVIIDIEKDKESNTFWVGTLHGLHHFDPVTKTFKAYHHIEGDANSLFSDTVSVVKADTKDKLWVGTYMGLQTMDIKTGKFTKRFQKNVPFFFRGNIIEDILTDKNNRVWVATGGGLNRLDEQTGNFKQDLPNTLFISCIMEDSNGNLWAATSQGLHKYNKEKDEFVLFTDASGLLSSSTSISWITEDYEKNLWLNTSLGIIKLNAEKNTTVLYGKDQGVDPGAMNNFRYIWENNFGYIRENEEILYGDSSGYFAFQPKQLMQNIPAPLV
ncbi:MAG TPA: two-component regulator propeller domain-containing protein, partial [Hanamia sp.]